MLIFSITESWDGNHLGFFVHFNFQYLIELEKRHACVPASFEPLPNYSLPNFAYAVHEYKDNIKTYKLLIKMIEFLAEWGAPLSG